MKDEHTTSKIVEVKTTPKLPYVGKDEYCGCIAEWPMFLGIFLAKEVKTRFSKMGPLPNLNFCPYSSHSM